ncbi:hypothetical protein [Mycolicibacterium chlorophenolicum]|uniref:DUF732 domain-containing protein n=1 Tax=Mycolicibacterium chlorophenolicum TaxID=37916 RepID=A0A0J6Y1K5_9MYCO|nr:hypothetical protein [Mycolicibacterium chlorophenolicum]KMO67106.1 hypothetical protein MCHLDSM_06355 [Mycolicibacterium chlorophenolicum]
MKTKLAIATTAALLASGATAHASPQTDAVWAYKNGDKVCNFFASGVDSVSIGQAISYVKAYGLPPDTVVSATMWNCPETYPDVAGYFKTYPD